jgi:kynurenine formamidase
MLSVRRAAAMTNQLVELSHEIESGMITHPGIPAPAISTFLSHEASAERYAPGTTFEIARIDMVANTGTYVDTPAHRYPGGEDLSEVPLERFVDLDGVVVDCRDRAVPDIDASPFRGVAVAGRAVLVLTGWDANWGSPAYLAGNPCLSEDAARWLVEEGAALVGIDSLNVDSITDPRRPAHSVLLGAGVPIVEHLTGLSGLPRDGFRFFAAPPRIRGMATFPVRAFGLVPAGPRQAAR